MPDPNYFNQFEKADDDYFSQFEKEPSLAVSHGEEPKGEGLFNQGLDLAAVGLKKGGELISKIDKTFGVHDKPGEPKLNPLTTSPGEIPGVRAGADYIQNKLQNTGNYGAGFLGGLVSYGGELTANAFDPGQWFIKGEPGIPHPNIETPNIPIPHPPEVPEPQRLLPSGSYHVNPEGEVGTLNDLNRGFTPRPSKLPNTAPIEGEILPSEPNQTFKLGQERVPLSDKEGRPLLKQVRTSEHETKDIIQEMHRDADNGDLKAAAVLDSEDPEVFNNEIRERRALRRAKVIEQMPNPLLNPRDANAYIQAVRSGEAKGIPFEEWKKLGSEGILTPEKEPYTIKNAPPNQRARMFRGNNEPVDILFDDPESREIFGAGQRSFVKGIPKEGWAQRFQENTTRLVNKYKISEQEARTLIIDYNKQVREMGKSLPVEGGDFTAPTIDEFFNIHNADPIASKIVQAKKPKIKLNLDGSYTVLEGETPITGNSPTDYINAIDNKEIDPKVTTFENFKNSIQETLGRFITDDEGGLKLNPLEWGKKSDKEGKPVITRRAPTQTAMGKLIDALKEHSFDREKQELIYAEDKGKRIANFANEIKEGGGKSAFFKGVGKMAGEYDKVSPVEVKMGARDVTALYNQINLSKKITDFEKLRTGLALAKLLEGKSVLQRNELALFDRVFGTGTSAQIMELHGGIGLTGIKLAKTANTMKSLQSTIDLSAPFRQGIGLAHRKEYWSAFSEMFKYAKSEDAFQAAMKSIEEHPNYLFNRESGLFIADHEIGGHEEQFMDSYLNDFHDLLKKKLDPAKVDQYSPTRASERAYVGFLNKLRADTMNALLQKYEKAGIPLYDMVKGKRVPNEFSKKVAEYINVSTGRGSIGSLEKAGQELNALIYSPRLISSRLKLTGLDPRYYINMPKPLRMEAVKTLMSIAGAVGITNVLGSVLLNGKTTLTPNKVNLTNPDFGKLKLGKVRLDPGGGFLQYVTAASQFLTNSSTSSTSGVNYSLGRYGQPTRGSKVLGVMGSQPSFLENKLSPMARLADDILSMPGRTEVNGQPINIPTHIRKAFTMLFPQDMWDLAKTDPDLLPVLGPLGGLGMGITSYQDRPDSGNEGLKLPGLGLR